MFPIDSFIKLAISFVEIPISIVDTEYQKVSGIDQRVTTGTRTIQAGVDPTNSKNMERIFGGSLSDGDIGVYTEEQLYIEDSYNPDQSELNRSQSFVNYQGMIYRVAQIGDWTPQAGVSVYLCKKYFDQNGGF